MIAVTFHGVCAATSAAQRLHKWRGKGVRTEVRQFANDKKLSKDKDMLWELQMV